MKEKIWHIKEEFAESVEAEELLEDGWEPFSVRKGDFVFWGFSLGWFFASPIIYFKKLLPPDEVSNIKIEE